MASALLEAGHTGNLFLDTLASTSYEKLAPFLEPVKAPTGAVIASHGVRLEYVCFPTTCVISRVARMRDGTDVEIALVGREGFYGTQVVLGTFTSASEAMVQVRDVYLRMRSNDFKDAIDRDELLRVRALRYVQSTIDSIGQLSACNRLHPINDRCARWLLMAHDRVPSDEVRLTHDFLAMMLGVRRPGVSVAAAALETAGFISYHRGLIHIENRMGLEGASCECYDAVSESLPRLLGYDIRKSRSNEPMPSEAVLEVLKPLD